MAKSKNILKTFLVAAVVVMPVVLACLPAQAAGNLAGYWKFDESVTGQDALDSSGNGNDGHPNTFSSSMPTPSSDTPPSITFDDPYSASFDGDNYFLIDRPVQDDFTICAWVKTTSAGNGPNHWETAPIMDSEVGGVTNDFGFGIASDGTLAYGNGDTNGNDIALYGSTVVNDGQWHYVCVSRDSVSGAVILYVDAQADSSGYTSPGTLDANPEARIGYGYDGAALFDGLIDDARAYNVVLTQPQIANLLSGSNNPNAPGDGDGISPAEEDAAPHGGDANNDGTLDSVQASVASFLNDQTGLYTTVESSSACNLSALSGLAASSLPTNDGNYTYSAGLLNFTADCGTPNYTATITVYYYGLAGHDLVLRKYDPGNHTYSPVTGTTISAVTIGGSLATKVSYQVTDGGALDSDHTADGIIVDPVGLARLTPSATTANSQAAATTPLAASRLDAPNTGAARQSTPTRHTLALLAALTLPFTSLSLLYGLAKVHRQSKAS